MGLTKMKTLINDQLRYIMTYIETCPKFLYTNELLSWCEDEGYVKTFMNNLDLILHLIDQHNSQFI